MLRTGIWRGGERGKKKLLSSARKLPEADRDPKESAEGGWRRRFFTPSHTVGWI